MSSPSSQKISEALALHGLKKTAVREQILNVFLRSAKPLQQADVLERLDGEADRISVYRNLKQFVELGLLHEVEPNAYIFCHHECSTHPHVLLFCIGCKSHKEIEQHQQIDSFLGALKKLHFFGNNQPISIRGLCAACA